MSVAFGRFENDSLSWERWSSFPQNKYLEEVEKCATPGSVAEKKAYFEAHYRKIAARKAKLFVQEEQLQDDSRQSNDQSGRELIENLQVGYQDRKVNAEGDRREAVEQIEDALWNREDESVVVETVEAEENAVDVPVASELKEAELVNGLETTLATSPAMKELAETVNMDAESIQIKKDESVKLDPPKASQKVNPTCKIRDVTRVKKKPALPGPKSPQVPRVSKAAATPSMLTAPRSSVRKPVGLSSPLSRNATARDNKKVAPNSLHMSMSFDSPFPDSTPPTNNRKSLIMEKMGDKDIVKRAFKMFQNNFDQLKASAEKKSFGAKQMPANGQEVKVSATTTLRNESVGSTKPAFQDKRNAKAPPSRAGSGTDERIEKRKELSKKSEDTSNPKDARKLQSRIKSKEAKEADIRKQEQKLNSKATPSPGHHRGQKVTKSPLDKERNSPFIFTRLRSETETQLKATFNGDRASQNERGEF